jgi:ABC-type multidrug transport system ATPase subunit
LSLLALTGITARSFRVPERNVLRDVSLTVEAAEVVAVWGRGRSGRSTLLRIAAGIERPIEGDVTFDGRPVFDERFLGRHHGLAYPQSAFSRLAGVSVVEQLETALLAKGLAPASATCRANEALHRVGAEQFGGIDPIALEPHEVARVMIGRALLSRPRILLVDDPVYGVDLSERDSILRLLHSLARDDGLAVLFTASHGTELAGADRVLRLDNGVLRGDLHTPKADITPITTRRRGRGME